MGTLFDQPARSHHDKEDIFDMVAFYKQLSIRENIAIRDLIEIEEVILLKRRNNLYRENGNIWDEQISGIGQILNKIADALSQEGK